MLFGSIPGGTTIHFRFSSEVDFLYLQSKDGYIFPIMDDEYEKKHVTKDYAYKKFREYLNIWLKEVGKELETTVYTFCQSEEEN